MPSDAAYAAIRAQTKIKQHAEEMGSYLKDMQTWEKNIKLKEKGLKAKPKARIPPVRASGGLVPVGATVSAVATSSSSSKSKEDSAAKHTYDKGYQKWDKFDINKALDSVDTDADPEVEEYEAITPIKATPATMVAHSIKALPQRGVQVAQPKPALKTPSEREADERQKGNDLFQKGEFEKAIKAYTACLGISNRSVLAFSNRAMCWLKLKEWIKAEADATLALQVDPRHIKSYQRRASARNAMGMHRAALGDLTQANQLDTQATFTKALNIDIRKTKELLKSAMRNAPATSLKVMLDYSPTLPPSSSCEVTSNDNAVETSEQVGKEGTVVNIIEDENDNDGDGFSSQTEKAAMSTSSKIEVEEINEVNSDLEQKEQESEKPKVAVRSSTTVKLTYSNNSASDAQTHTASSDSDEIPDSGGIGTSSQLTPANMTSFKYNAGEDALHPNQSMETQGNVMHKLSIEEEEEVDISKVSKKGASSGIKPLDDTEALLSIKQQLSSPFSSSSSIKADAKKVKIPDPKGPFELERLWRNCGSDGKMKTKCAKKWLRPDGKIAARIFGNNKSVPQSCPLDSDILCDLLLHRIKGMLSQSTEKKMMLKSSDVSLKKSPESYEDFLLSIQALIRQPKFKSSIAFLSASHIELLDQVMKESKNEPVVDLLNSVLHP